MNERRTLISIEGEFVPLDLIEMAAEARHGAYGDDQASLVLRSMPSVLRYVRALEQALDDRAPSFVIDDVDYERGVVTVRTLPPEFGEG